MFDEVQKVDRHLKCLTLTDGAQLCLQAMDDSDRVNQSNGNEESKITPAEEFNKLKQRCIPDAAEPKVILKMPGSIKTHILAVPGESYQLIIVNHLFWLDFYKDSTEAQDPSKVAE